MTIGSRKIINRIVLVVGLVAGLSLVGAGAVCQPVAAAKCQGFDCANKKIEEAKKKTGRNESLGQIAKTIVDTILTLIGIMAVIMIIVGGIRYAISGGDQNKVASAKNLILYAVIGLTVAILGYALVGFVFSSLQ